MGASNNSQAAVWIPKLLNLVFQNFSSNS